MSELKPCPFCGEMPELYTRPCYYYQCVKSSCEGQEVSWNNTEEEALKSWNTRPIEDALQAEIDQLRKDNQSLAEQIHIMAEFLVAEGICPFTPCILERPHTDEDCMFCWEHRGNSTKGDKP